MRKFFAVVGALWLLVPCTGLGIGCEWRHADICRSTEGVGCPSAETQCDGVCVAYMDAGWDMALVTTSPEGSPPLHCPSSAPNAGMSGKEQLTLGGRPRHVLACSVNPTPTCDSATAVCMPVEPGFMPCILRDGTHDCLSSYAHEIAVVDGSGNTVTVCCEGEPELT